MSTEENKAIVRKYRAAHNQNNLDALDAIVAQDLTSHAALPGLPTGLAGGKMAHQIFLGSFSDLQTTTEDLIAEGDKVMERYTTRGTHTGDVHGRAAHWQEVRGRDDGRVPLRQRQDRRDVGLE